MTTSINIGKQEVHYHISTGNNAVINIGGATGHSASNDPPVKSSTKESPWTWAVGACFKALFSAGAAAVLKLFASLLLA